MVSKPLNFFSFFDKGGVESDRYWYSRILCIGLGTVKVYMRILYIVPDLYERPGGIARYAQMVCHALANPNCQLQVVVLMDHQKSIHAYTPSLPGISYYACNGSRSLLVRKCIETAVNHPPDIILVGHVNFAPLGFMLAQFVQARYATFIYGVDVWHPLPWHRRLGTRHSDKIISISQFTLEHAMRNHNVGQQKKTAVLHNCLPDKISIADDCREQGLSLSMLTVSRLVKHKGHEYVLHAMPQILQSFPYLLYHIVGDGEMAESLKRLAAELGITHAVRFHGWVSEESLQAHYADASIFVMPSRGEGFGFVFIEALARGLPVVAGNTDATPEVVIDGQIGLLVDPTSVEAIATAIIRLLQDPELRREMGQNGRQYVNQQFGFAHFQYLLLTYIGELVNQQNFADQMAG
ncbi:MAG: glycosyltransferase family 4 protein [Anaerolineales bacterium]|nr:glycosyltransferase family 4 protein [Anaerolineales bacterium]